MKIYTKKGDQGKTGLIGGTRVSKNDLKINAYGTVDELNAFVGLLRDLIDDSNCTSQLIEIQDRLFTAGSLLAVSEEGTKMKIPTNNVNLFFRYLIKFTNSAIGIMSLWLPFMLLRGRLLTEYIA